MFTPWDIITPDIIGIIGNTHGVRDSKRPNPKNVRRITAILPSFMVLAIVSVSENSVASRSFTVFAWIKTSLFTSLPTNIFVIKSQMLPEVILQWFIY